MTGEVSPGTHEPFQPAGPAFMLILLMLVLVLTVVMVVVVCVLLLLLLVLVVQPAAARCLLRGARGQRQCQPGQEAQAVVQHKPGDRYPCQVAHVAQRAQVDAPPPPP